MNLTIHLTGLRPMLPHSSRLADPINSYTMALAEITGKRRKTQEDLMEMMRLEARGGCWETAEGLLGMPDANVAAHL